MELECLLWMLPVTLLGFFIPGCPCCESCLYFADDFNRADDTNLGADWTESAGSWSITSNQLVTSSTGAICLLNTPHPDGNEESKVVVQATGTNSGNIIRIILDYVDASNYHYAEWRIATNGHLRIYRRLSGTDTLLKTFTLTRTVGVFCEFSACISPSGVFTTSLDTGSVFNGIAAVITPHGGDQVGVATGGTVAGSVKFDDFSAFVINEDCPGCGVTCVECQDGSGPTEFKVTISGLADFLCGDCESLDGEYLLPHTSLCHWELISVIPCGDDPIYLEFGDLGGVDGYTVTLTINEAIWRHPFGATKPDCHAIDNLALTLTPEGPARPCTHAGATCLLSAVS